MHKPLARGDHLGNVCPLRPVQGAAANSVEHPGINALNQTGKASGQRAVTARWARFEQSLFGKGIRIFEPFDKWSKVYAQPLSLEPLHNIVIRKGVQANVDFANDRNRWNTALNANSTGEFLRSFGDYVAHAPHAVSYTHLRAHE